MLLDQRTFLDAICLLLHNSDEIARRLVKTAVEEYNVSCEENPAVRNTTSDLYVSIITGLLDPDVRLNIKSDRSRVLMAHKDHPAIKESPSLFEQLQNLMFPAEPPSQRRINAMERTIRSAILWNLERKALGRMFAKNASAATSTDPLTQDMLISEVLEHARDLVRSIDTSVGKQQRVTADDPIDFIDMSDKTSIGRALQMFRKQRSTSVFKTGLQGLNKLFGEPGGPCRGEFVAIAALAGNYKTGILKDFLRWITTINNPGTEAGIQPAVVFISLEDEVHKNLMSWFAAAYIQAYKKAPENLTDEEIVVQVLELYTRRNFKPLIFRKLRGEFSYHDFIELQSDLKTKGYTVVATIVDYLSLMKIDDNDGKSNTAVAIQNLFGAFKQFANHSGQLIITGIQLDTAAATVAASGVVNVVKHFGQCHLADCKGILRELDVLIFQHIERNHLGVPYLTQRVYRHRHETLPPNPYVAYRFSPTVGIMDDVDGESQAIYDIFKDDRPPEGEQGENCGSTLSVF